ncbi:MAG: MAPEG family protein [Rhodospirillales bacterium]|nr:MAPEG family protein [Rhodospirillales bacterium]
MRARTKIVIQDGGDQTMATAVRCFGNFAEYVPLALVLIAVLELNGGSATALHTLGVALVAGRTIHPFGLDAEKPITVGRVVGQSLTWGVVLVASALLLSQVWGG